MSKHPDDPEVDASDPRDGAGSTPPDGPDENSAGSGEAVPGSGLGNLEDGGSDLVDKIQNYDGRSSGAGATMGSCGGCVLLVLVIAAVGAVWFYPGVPLRLLPGSADSTGTLETARGVFAFELPGETRGIVHLRAGLDVALLVNERGRGVVKLAVFQFPGGWPGWIREFFLRVMGSYWRWREGFSPGEFDADRRMLCGRTVRVESAAQRTDKGVATVRRRACVRRQGSVKCILMLGLGGEPETATRDVIDSLRCP